MIRLTLSLHDDTAAALGLAALRAARIHRDEPTAAGLMRVAVELLRPGAGDLAAGHGQNRENELTAEGKP